MRLVFFVLLAVVLFGGRKRKLPNPDAPASKRAREQASFFFRRQSPALPCIPDPNGLLRYRAVIPARGKFLALLRYRAVIPARGKFLALVRYRAVIPARGKFLALLPNLKNGAIIWGHGPQWRQKKKTITFYQIWKNRKNPGSRKKQKK